MDGPALVYVTQEGVALILDRLPPPTEALVEGPEVLSARDAHLLRALWDTFTNQQRWWQRHG